MGATDVAFFMKINNLFIYSDESGVFDYKHNKYFLFGGLICFNSNEMERTARKYAHVEKVMRQTNKYEEVRFNRSSTRYHPYQLLQKE